MTHSNITTTSDHESMSLFCSGTSPQWSKGSDLCDMETFTSYDRCNEQNLCNVPSSDYLMEVSTFFCCASAEGMDCWQIVSK